MTAAQEPAADRQDVAAGKAVGRPIGGAAPLLTTRWLPISGYEGRYEVSDDGQVRTLPRPGTRVKEAQVKRLRSPRRKTRKGYWEVALWSGPSAIYRSVHVLMLEAFVGPRPPGTVAMHADDNPDNNTLPNLRWGTQSENCLDMVANGNHHEARKTHCKWGHPLEGDNLSVKKDGERECLACKHRRNAEYRARKRWPIWSEPRAYERTPCNICGFSGGQHSNVCPWGPEPTRSKQIADYLPELSPEQAADAAQDAYEARELGLEREES